MFGFNVIICRCVALALTCLVLALTFLHNSSECVVDGYTIGNITHGVLCLMCDVMVSGLVLRNCSDAARSGCLVVDIWRAEFLPNLSTESLHFNPRLVRSHTHTSAVTESLWCAVCHSPACLHSVFGKPRSKESICTSSLACCYFTIQLGCPVSLRFDTRLFRCCRSPSSCSCSCSSHGAPTDTPHCCLSSPSLTHLAVDKHIITSDLYVSRPLCLSISRTMGVTLLRLQSVLSLRTNTQSR